MVAEISGPSLGVGFEIAYALYKSKIPVLAVANKEVENISAMVNGCDSKLLEVKFYSDDKELLKIVDNFIDEKQK